MTGERQLCPLTARPGGIVAAVRTGVGHLIDLFANIVNKLTLLSPLALATSCADPEAAAAIAPAPAPVIVAPAPIEKAAEPKDAGPIGEFDVTFYYVTSEEEVAATIAKKQAAAAANSNVAAGEGTELTGVTPEPPPREIVPLYEQKTCAVLAEVDKEFAVSLALQGTGRLMDGRLLNVAAKSNCPCDRKPCFHEIENQQWGKAGTGRSLVAFRTVAVDPTVIKLGSLLHIPQIEGRTMPGRPPWGGFVHDGCVVADDTGGGIKGHQIDLFVGRKGHYFTMASPGGSHAWARHVQVFDGAKLCERKGRRIGRKTASI